MEGHGQPIPIRQDGHTVEFADAGTIVFSPWALFDHIPFAVVQHVAVGRHFDRGREEPVKVVLATLGASDCLSVQEQTKGGGVGTIDIGDTSNGVGDRFNTYLRRVGRESGYIIIS